MDADRIGVDHEGATAGAELDEAEGLLQPAEEQAKEYAYDGSDNGDETALEEEDACYLMIAGSEVAQGDDIVLLFDDEHRERTDDVEASYHEDEGEEDVGNELLYLHDLERVVLLLEAVADIEAVAGYLLYLGLHAVEVAAWLQAQLERRDAVFLLEEIAGKLEAGDDVVLVVLGLTDAEQDTRRVELVLTESGSGVGHVELSLTLRSIDGHGILVGDACAEFLCQTDARNAVVHVSGMELELAVANEYFVDVGQTIEVVIDTLDGDHSLTRAKGGQGLVFETVGGNVDSRQLAYLHERGVVGVDCLAAHGCDLQLRVERCEERRHEVVEAVEHGERDHQGHGCHDNADNGDGADDVDGVGRLLGEEVAAGDVKREIHFADELFTDLQFTDLLLLQQLIDAVDIVERVVDEEAQLGNDAQLVSHART